MQKEKYQVFISSPFMKLAKERKAAVQAVISWHQIPIALDSFSAESQKDSAVIKRAIGECQIYILILGHTYGSIMPNSDISYTEYEFDRAVDHGMDVLAFMQDIREVEQEINSDKDIKNKDIELNRIKKFHEKIRKRSFYKPWGKSTNFEEACSRALAGLLFEQKVTLPGWIRAGTGKERDLQMALSNEFISNTVTNLNSFKKLDERCGQDVGEKEAMAKCFREYFLDGIISRGNSLFFESGPCPAFVAKELGSVDISK